MIDKLLELEETFKSRKFLKPEELDYLSNKYTEKFPKRKMGNCPACILEAFKLLKDNTL